MMDIHRMLLILTETSWPSTQDKITIRLLFKSAPATDFNSIRFTNSVQQTSHCSIDSKSFTVHQHNHSESLLLSVETAFTSVKAIHSPWFQQSSAASKAPSSLFKEAKSSVFSRLNFTAEITSLSSKGLHSRNTLEVQSSFRNCLLNTVYQL